MQKKNGKGKGYYDINWNFKENIQMKKVMEKEKNIIIVAN